MKNRKCFIITSLLLTLGISLIFITTKSYFNSNTNNKVIISENNKNSNKNIIAFKVEQDDGSYKEQTDVPGSGYVFNGEKSTCTNGVTPKWEDSGIFLDNLTSSGTSCYLTFDKLRIQQASTIIADITKRTEYHTGTPTFTNAATTDEGIYSTSDPIYGGTSYYWRGASTTNHVIFADKCWRIVRINGDGTMRLIYNGGVLEENKCIGNGVDNSGSIARASQQYNALRDRSEYVGYTYTEGSPRGTASSSSLKTQTEDWYKAEITDKGFDGKVVAGKFCNDRNLASGYTKWESQPTSIFYYAGYDRSGARYATTVNPTLACNADDVYTEKAGAITMDEVIMSGAKWNTRNDKYYLYNGQYYWTMSPYHWYYYYAIAPTLVARVFYTTANGELNFANVNDTHIGLRPVINLNDDVTFNEGSDGTQDNPYIVQ